MVTISFGRRARDLQDARRRVQEREQTARHGDPDGMVAPEERHCDAREPEPGREVRVVAVVAAQDVDHADQPGDAPDNTMAMTTIRLGGTPPLERRAGCSRWPAGRSRAETG